MARMYPKSIIDHDTPGSERRVFEALSRLDDSWMVFHSVPWKGERRGRQLDGETDFIVAHKNRGALVIEVKGGEITIQDGQWGSVDHSGTAHAIDPIRQARESKHHFGAYLAERLSRTGSRVHMGHAVICPDVELEDELTTDGPREIFLDREDLKAPERSLARALRCWDDLTCFDDEQFRELREELAPTRRVRRLLCHQVAESTDRMIELTEQQTHVFAAIRKQKRAMVVGGAGTGKTLLALERAKQLSDEGLRVLLVCFNAPLSRHLAGEVAGCKGVVAGTFHKITRDMIMKADPALLPPQPWDDSTWNTEFPELLTEAAGRLGVEFDAVVIDEGQDFHPTWWTSLKLLLKDPDGGFFYMFADEHQNLYREDWDPPLAGEPFVLDINCRNTHPVAERVNAIFNLDLPSLAADGTAPTFDEVEGSQQAQERIPRIIDKLVKGKLDPEQITVLSTKSSLIKNLQRDGIPGHSIATPEDPRGGITVETARRFKGLESDAVILFVHEANGELQKRLAYVGMSRARVLLHVLGPPSARSDLAWG